MSGSPEDVAPDQKRSLLGGALSIEFADCSVVASDLSALAHDKMESAINDSGTETEMSRFIIGSSDDGPEQLVGVRVPNKFGGNQLFKLDGMFSRLMLIQPLEGVEESTTQKSQGLRRHAPRWLTPGRVLKPDVAKPVSDPTLAVSVGEDTLLPIASFALRDDGQCSYVQLGQEMHDDNFFVTPTDEASSRQDIIDALCTWLESSGDTRQAKQVIQQFINQQAEGQHAALVEAYEQQLVRKAFENIGTNPRESHLTIVGNEKLGPQAYALSSVIPSCILEDGRAVSLELGRPAQSDKWLGDRLSLLGVTRGDVAVQLGSLSQSSMKLELSDDVSLDTSEREDVVRDLFGALTNRAAYLMRSNLEKNYKSENMGLLEKQVAEYCFQLGLLRESERHLYRSGVGPHSKPSEQRIDPPVEQLLGTFFAYPDPDHSPFPDSPPLQIALDRLSIQQEEDRLLFQRLGADTKLAEFLGETRRCDEMLMRYVARLALIDDGLEAVMEDIPMSRRPTSAHVRATVEAHDGLSELIVMGRPASMSTKPMERLGISTSLYPDKPFLGHEEQKDGSFSEEKVSALVGILSDIFRAQLDSWLLRDA